MSSTFTPQSVHAAVSMSNVTSSNGCLGIGTTTPASALDVKGSVNVSGTIMAGNVGLQYWKYTGTTGTAGTSTTYGLPAGCVYGNIVAAYGGYTNVIFFPFNNTWTTTHPNDPTWSASLYINNTNGINIDVGSASTSAASRPFTVIIVTAS